MATNMTDIRKLQRSPYDTAYNKEHSTQMTPSFAFKVNFAPTVVRLKTCSLYKNTIICKSLPGY